MCLVGTLINTEMEVLFVTEFHDATGTGGQLIGFYRYKQICILGVCIMYFDV